MSLFSKILIANRGAIATRTIRTLDAMGIASVAVYAESDRDSLHVRYATQACSLGDGDAAATYLNMEKLIEIAAQTECQAIYPGYGFLSENSEFVRRCQAESIAFIGPTAQQIDWFGQKHVARDLAQKAGVSLPPGSGLLTDVANALTEAQRIGFPVMLKSTAGGGGIGMKLCNDEATLIEAFDAVKRLSGSYFSNDGVFVEKAILQARHIEVQVIGNGEGIAVAVGERDCSTQRRNQKVIEECPAPKLSSRLRQRLHDTAENLLASVNYRNAGTVEFILDTITEQFYFLEVNTRLQVEHGVTEMVYGVDLIELMVRLASNETDLLDDLKQQLTPRGHAIQARIYAEDPFHDFRPCPGLLSHVSWPAGDGVRIDHWIESGITVSADFDPMLAKVIVHDSNRDRALDKLQRTLGAVELYGNETNLAYLKSLAGDDALLQGEMTTRYLDSYEYQTARVDVLRGGTMTTIQDVPGRVGYWSVGIPPSGPFDSLSFQMANRMLGNDIGCAGLEITLDGPSLQFSCSCQVVVAGGDVEISLDGKLVNAWTILSLEAGQILDIGAVRGAGMRAYLCVAGGLQCPTYLESRSTFTLGQFGGHSGAAIKTGDVLHLHDSTGSAADTAGTDSEVIDSQYSSDDSGTAREATAPQTGVLPKSLRPALTNQWCIRVVYGPHGAPDFFTNHDIEQLFDVAWEVHYNSSRTGVRLIGPAPQWAREDGGEAGLHPSNIHDNAYAFGSIDFTGDMPVILGPDGPSLGGFVCPATVITADLWKIGQLRAGDKLHFRAVGIHEAVAADQWQQTLVASINNVELGTNPTDEFSFESGESVSAATTSPVVATHESASLSVVYRVAGDRFLLIEYGEPKLDLLYRFRVHTLMQWLDNNTRDGIVELTPGIRSLQVHYNPHQLSLDDLLEHLIKAEHALDSVADSTSVPSRVVHLPLSWDDEACREAVVKYDQSVRKDAPWYPSNLEFIRRINGLQLVDDVKNIVFDASYLVMGLGDVYLGAPVATPINPAHRLVTTKYNPARTWTAENSVGIGGSYLCVYGMEGPGGYQFVGRTLQMWNRYRQTAEFEKPWLLRFFDQIRFYEVTHDELMEFRRDFPVGRHALKIEHTEFSLSEFQALVKEQRSSIDSFTQGRERAFDQELSQWKATGQFNVNNVEPEVPDIEQNWPEGCVVIESPVTGSLWRNCVSVGDRVESGQTLLVLESMKMEINVSATDDLRVRQILFDNGQRVSAGQPLIVLEN